MKFSLSSHQTSEYLKKADEIKVQYRDRRSIPDLIEKYPTATINLTRYYIDSTEDIDWNEINMYNGLSQGHFIFGLTLYDEMNMARAKNITYYHLAPVRTFAELNDLKRAGVCRVSVTAPLFFQLKKVKSFGIPVYATANVSQGDSLFSRPDGVTGCWIRPEDVETYEPYIDILDFSGDKTQEQALYRIYAEKKEWPGELGLLVQDLNYQCTNRMVPPTLAERRIECGQKCQENGNCRLCYRTFDLANPELLKNYLNQTENN